MNYFLDSAAAAAKSLPLCPTLCNPRDGSPPGSPVPGILQAKTREWVAISFSNAWKWKVKVKSLSHVRFLATPWSCPWGLPGKSPGVGCHCLLHSRIECFRTNLYALFKSIYWIHYNIASVSCFDLLVVRHVGSQFPNQESKPHTSHWKASPNHWSTRKVPLTHLKWWRETYRRHYRFIHAYNNDTELRGCCRSAAAKSLQSCLTLCDPIDGSLPGSPVPGSLQARTLEWVAISFSDVNFSQEDLCRDGSGMTLAYCV